MSFHENVCLPNAVADALEFLGVSLSDQEKERYQLQRLKDLKNKPNTEEFDSYRELMTDLFERELAFAQQMADSYSCEVVGAELYTSEDLLDNTRCDQRIILLIHEGKDGHAVHIREVSDDGSVIYGNDRWRPSEEVTLQLWGSQFIPYTVFLVRRTD